MLEGKPRPKDLIIAGVFRKFVGVLLAGEVIADPFCVLEVWRVGVGHLHEEHADYNEEDPLYLLRSALLLVFQALQSSIHLRVQEGENRASEERKQQAQGYVDPEYASRHIIQEKDEDDGEGHCRNTEYVAFEVVGVSQQLGALCPAVISIERNEDEERGTEIRVGKAGVAVGGEDAWRSPVGPCACIDQLQEGEALDDSQRGHHHLARKRRVQHVHGEEGMREDQELDVEGGERSPEGVEGVEDVCGGGTAVGVDGKMGLDLEGSEALLLRVQNHLVEDPLQHDQQAEEQEQNHFDEQAVLVAQQGFGLCAIGHLSVSLALHYNHYCINRVMAKKAWFDEERIEQQEAHVFIPYDIESPLHHPIIDPPEDPRHDHPERSGPRLITTTLARMLRRSQARKGRERDTSNLSKFVFSVLKRLLETQFLTCRLGRAEVEVVREFVGARGRLSSYELLLQSESIRIAVQAKLESSLVVREILESRMAYSNKVMAVRLLENIRSICRSAARRWKP